jgi:hypothetical protein
MANGSPVSVTYFGRTYWVISPSSVLATGLVMRCECELACDARILGKSHQCECEFQSASHSHFNSHFYIFFFKEAWNSIFLWISEYQNDF